MILYRRWHHAPPPRRHLAVAASVAARNGCLRPSSLAQYQATHSPMFASVSALREFVRRNCSALMKHGALYSMRGPGLVDPGRLDAYLLAEAARAAGPSGRLKDGLLSVLEGAS